MRFSHPRGAMHVPDGMDEGQALRRCSHMGIGAHQDDLEIMAFHGVLECYDSGENWFCGVTCTDGSGGPRKAGLESLSPGEISELRNQEQNSAADLGRYGTMAQLNLSSADIKGKDKSVLAGDLYKLLTTAQPVVVYTHNPADKHDTHIGVVVATLQAIRQLPANKRPDKLYGCEVWRDLDWMNDDEKVCLDATEKDELALRLISCHASQITTAKRYDLATIGRRRANATYADSHSNSAEESITFAMDLSALIQDERIDLMRFVAEKIKGFEQSVMAMLASHVEA